jgi:hypothetical protein
MNAGKGDKPRPIDKRIFDKNFDSINWRAKKEPENIKITKSGKTSFVYK